MHGRVWLVLGSVLAGLAVALGAFGAHGLKAKLLPKDASPEVRALGQERLVIFHTGAEYQMTHALALLVVGLVQDRLGRCRRLTAAGGAFLLGILLFSGSLYLLVLLDQPKFGAITPFGGVAFLVGWALLALAIARPNRPNRPS